MHTRLSLLALIGVAVSGCTWDEGLTIENMTGTVVLPPEALTRTFVDEDGTSHDVTDERLIGPVYLGLYSETQEGLEDYPYPAVGPQFAAGVEGDTYPYGGTTIGDLRFACVVALSCRVSSGRYETFDDLVDWFRDTLQDPILDQFNKPVPNGDYLEQVCLDILEVDSPDEVRITGDTDFHVRNDGKYEAPFTIWQQDYFDNSAQVAREHLPQSEEHGFTLWGFMDAPSVLTYQFSTCNPSAGYLNTVYNNFFYGGVAYSDILNRPAFYISEGDWVSSEPFVYQNWYDSPELALDFEVTP